MTYSLALEGCTLQMRLWDSEAELESVLKRESEGREDLDNLDNLDEF